MKHNHHFVVPIKYYVYTLAGLLLLTIITVYTAKYVHLSANIALVLALVIACTKAALVVLFFMGLRWDTGFNRVFFLGTIFFFLVFLVITLIDYKTRDDIYPDRTKTYDLQSPVQQKKPSDTNTDTHHNRQAPKSKSNDNH